MQIVLFGGAFDPPHLGHQQIAASVLEEKLADEVWYVPAKIHVFNKQMSSEQHRLAMLQLSLQPSARIELGELNKSAPSRSLDTLNDLSSQYPEHQFSWVIGSDNLVKFHLWYQYQELVAKYKFYVYPRAGYPMQPLYPNMQVLEKVPVVEVSSTQVREKIAQGQTWENLVNPAVAEYIKQHNLYQEDNS